jgi:V/A-type H+-transporting ATPase subunit A
VKCIGNGDRKGSITVVGAVSPPGGDFSEPVTQNTLRVVKVFWALDSDLADRRHFPAINWLRSYSLYLDAVKEWWGEQISENWIDARNKAMEILQKEDELREIVQLVGPDALPEREKAVLLGAKAIREDYLQQNSFHSIDTFCSEEKQVGMLELILHFYDTIMDAVSKGASVRQIEELPVLDKISRMKILPKEDFKSRKGELKKEIKDSVLGLVGGK